MTKLNEQLGKIRLMMGVIKESKDVSEPYDEKADTDYNDDVHDDGETSFKQKFDYIGELEQIMEKWTDEYKRSINCNAPRGFSQRAHCDGRAKKKRK
jgi:hypothetical protein